MAGALGVRLGGVNWYEGRATTMPYMGQPLRPLAPQRIHEAIRLMYTCSIVAWLAAMGALMMKSSVQAPGFMLQASRLACGLRLAACSPAGH